MAEWRIGRGWTDAELERAQLAARSLERNFTDGFDEMTAERGWQHYYSEAVVGRTTPGAPGEEGAFARGRKAVERYAFSDARIVRAHFPLDEPLLGRRLLLEMKALRILHFLGPVVVGAVRDETENGRSVFGFRYDTLEGHIERGAEWFLLVKDHASGEIRFRIQAAWRPGQFPNRWSQLGFALVGRFYQRVWHHRAHTLMAEVVRDPSRPTHERGSGRLAHSPPEVVFKRTLPETHV